MLTDYANENRANWIPKTVKAMCFGGMIASVSVAHALTADDVLNKMTDVERNNYVAGVVGGLAYSQFLIERPETTSMDCFYSWLYESDGTHWEKINSWFSRHLDKPAEPLLYILINKECGE